MIFITQGRYTEHATAGMLEHPEDRTPAFAALLKAAGIKLLAAYWTLGEYDFLVVVEAKDEHEWMKTLLVTAATGGLTDLKTMVAVSTADGEKAFFRRRLRLEKQIPSRWRLAPQNHVTYWGGSSLSRLEPAASSP